MLHPSWHNEQFTGSQCDCAISQFDLQCATNHPEQLVLMFVMMPVELTKQSRHLHVLPVELCHDVRRPVF